MEQRDAEVQSLFLDDDGVMGKNGRVGVVI